MGLSAPNSHAFYNRDSTLWPSVCGQAGLLIYRQATAQHGGNTIFGIQLCSYYLCVVAHLLFLEVRLWVKHRAPQARSLPNCGCHPNCNVGPVGLILFLTRGYDRRRNRPSQLRRTSDDPTSPRRSSQRSRTCPALAQYRAIPDIRNQRGFGCCYANPHGE